MAATNLPLESGIDTAHRRVIFASSLGTVFEWYDFYLYGSLAALMTKQFSSGVNETTGFIFALLAPVLLIALRLLPGLARGGEYGGAATYVAEHAPFGKRGLYTSWIQTTATLGLFLSLLVILFTRTLLGDDEFASWGWRVPFLASAILLIVSVYIRMQLNESPVFLEMKQEAKLSKAPLTESFARWDNLKVVILALLGATAGQVALADGRLLGDHERLAHRGRSVASRGAPSGDPVEK